MCNIQGNVISWTAVSGESPYVEKYLLTVHVRTIIGIEGETPQYQDASEIRLTLPFKYPIRPPKIVMVSSSAPFQPNWWQEQKMWSYGAWSRAESMGDFVIRLVRLLQFDMDEINEKSPSNQKANTWYIAQKHSGLFPCDRTKILELTPPNPAPGGSNLIINRRSSSCGFRSAGTLAALA